MLTVAIGWHGMPMFSPPGPPKYRPTPTDGPDLLVHPQRAGALSGSERRLVCVFLQRYLVWCARTRRIDPLRDATGLLIEIARRGATQP